MTEIQLSQKNINRLDHLKNVIMILPNENRMPSRKSSMTHLQWRTTVNFFFNTQKLSWQVYILCWQIIFTPKTDFLVVSLPKLGCNYDLEWEETLLYYHLSLIALTEILPPMRTFFNLLNLTKWLQLFLTSYP